ncbi:MULTISPECIES: cytochrome b [Caballeronia]|uniref:Cytochrome B561 n=1 Tax=Caballeronia cordobensis TaxID=1353886 RepID=A0A158IQD4_CABCO|nr:MULTISPECIES: cytochrome b [Caballeronia]AET92026.1 cytochrome B561 [Burkholderia sp. YI23]AQH00519.1 cytochrome B [Burkholderia sp. KK1]BAO88030.1 cytochrome B561 [Burkholderia sp. RPE67]BBP99297.1 cytochrome b [Burkholderia sp. SFA1]MCE4545435.1 cytochrome b [Caballeronia sp. PC1]
MSTARTSAASRDGRLPGPSERFAGPLIALHWLIAVAIIAMLCIGFYMVGLPRGLPFKSDLINFHKSLGITVFLLVLMRILVRLAYGRPPLPPMPTWQRAAASITQALLYVGMVAMPLTGYLGSSFNKFGTKFWGLTLPQWGWDDKHLRGIFFGIHETIAWIMAALVIVHFLGAMKHQLIDRDGLLRRMWP